MPTLDFDKLRSDLIKRRQEREAEITSAVLPDGSKFIKDPNNPRKFLRVQPEKTAEDIYSDSFASAAGSAAAKDTKDPLDELVPADSLDEFDVPYGTTNREILGKKPYVKPTGEQSKVSGYAKRAEQANQIFDKLEPEVLKLSAAGIAVRRKLPNIFKDPTWQRQEQAERNFINAVLRRESGAVINPDEYSNAEKQYFPRPGDGKEVLEQKKENRKLVQQNFIDESGSAYSKTETSKQEKTGPRIVGNVPTFDSEEEAVKYEKELPKGTIIMIGGRKAIVE